MCLEPTYMGEGCVNRKIAREICLNETGSLSVVFRLGKFAPCFARRPVPLVCNTSVTFLIGPVVAAAAVRKENSGFQQHQDRVREELCDIGTP